MFVPDKMRVNTFKDVRIPNPKDLFGRFGNQTVPDQYYTGDESATIGQSKIDQIEAYRKYAETMDSKPKE